MGMIAWSIKNLALYYAVGAWWHYSGAAKSAKSWADLMDYHKGLFFKISCIFQMIIFITFITLELCFTNNTVLNLSIPQLVILLQAFVLMVLVWWTTIRLGKCGTAEGGATPLHPRRRNVLIYRITDAFHQLFYLGFWLLFEFIGILLVDIDGVTNFALKILTRKAYLDLCAVLFLFGYHQSVVYGFGLLYPKRNFAMDMRCILGQAPDEDPGQKILLSTPVEPSPHYAESNLSSSISEHHRSPSSSLSNIQDSLSSIGTSPGTPAPLNDEEDHRPPSIR
jgi:hypothetical protein